MMELVAEVVQLRDLSWETFLRRSGRLWMKHRPYSIQSVNDRLQRCLVCGLEAIPSFENFLWRRN